MILVYFYATYMKRIISEQHEWDTFITLTILGQIHLPGDIHHPDVGSHLNLPRYSELRNCFSGILLFSLDILTRSNTLKLFPFLLLLTSSFSLRPLNNHMIIKYHKMIIRNYLPL